MWNQESCLAKHSNQRERSDGDLTEKNEAGERGTGRRERKGGAGERGSGIEEIIRVQIDALESIILKTLFQFYINTYIYMCLLSHNGK